MFRKRPFMAQSKSVSKTTLFETLFPMNEKIEQPHIDSVYLIGFRINPDSEAPEFYTLVDCSGDKDRTLTVDNDLIFFAKLEQKQQAFELFSKNIKKGFAVSDEVDLVADLAGALYLIENEDLDDSAIILNLLNTIFDLLYSADKQLSDDKKSLLWGFADHLTFEKEFKQYLSSNSINRQSIIDAILWSVGAIVSRSKILMPTD